MANLANTKWCKIPEKWLKPWHMGAHLRLLSESYLLKTNMRGYKWFSKIVAFLCLGQEEALALEGLTSKISDNDNVIYRMAYLFADFTLNAIYHQTELTITVFHINHLLVSILNQVFILPSLGVVFPKWSIHIMSCECPIYSWQWSLLHFSLRGAILVV